MSGVAVGANVGITDFLLMKYLNIFQQIWQTDIRDIAEVNFIIPHTSPGDLEKRNFQDRLLWKRSQTHTERSS